MISAVSLSKCTLMTIMHAEFLLLYVCLFMYIFFPLLLLGTLAFKWEIVGDKGTMCYPLYKWYHVITLSSSLYKKAIRDILDFCFPQKLVLSLCSLILIPFYSCFRSLLPSCSYWGVVCLSGRQDLRDH